MYIPEFWCGFIAGAVLAIVVITGLAVLCSRKENDEKAQETKERL